MLLSAFLLSAGGKELKGTRFLLTAPAQQGVWDFCGTAPDRHSSAGGAWRKPSLCLGRATRVSPAAHYVEGRGLLLFLLD